MAGSLLVLLLQSKRPAGPWVQWINSHATHLLRNPVNGLVADAALNLSANPISRASCPRRKRFIKEESKYRFRKALMNRIACSLFPQEFGWIDGKRSQGRNSRRCNAKQRHR